MNRVLAVAAHPDDIEFLMMGTLLHLANAGFEIHYWNLANGCCGSNEMTADQAAKTRRQESIDACKEAGAVFHEPVANDLSIFYEPELLAKVASTIRSIHPSIVLTHSLEDYMEDHTNTARLVVTGTFARGMKNFPVIPPADADCQPVCLYHAQPYTNRTPMRKLVVPDLFVDTTELMDRKRSLLACHRSQKEWLDHSQGLDSYLQTATDLDAEVGELSGRFQYAEGWRRHHHPGFAGPEDDFLANAIRSNQPKAIFVEDE